MKLSATNVEDDSYIFVTTIQSNKSFPKDFQPSQKSIFPWINGDIKAVKKYDQAFQTNYNTTKICIKIRGKEQRSSDRKLELLINGCTVQDPNQVTTVFN